MTRTRAVVHLGPIKSGTTALARYLTSATSQNVLPAGLVYPLGDLWMGRSGSIVRQRDDFDQTSVGPEGAVFTSAQTPGALDAVAHHLALMPTDRATALFIVETGGARLHPQALADSLLSRFDDVVLISMARRQDRALASIIAQRAKMWGQPSSLDPRVHLAAPDPDVESLHYDRITERWEGTGAEFRMIPYLEGDQATFAAIARIFHVLGLPTPVETKGIAGRRIHPTFSQEGMTALVEIKRRASRAWLPGSRERWQVRFDEAIAAYHASAISSGLEPSGRKFVPWALSDVDARWVLDLFHESNQRMLATVDRAGCESDWAAWEQSLGAAE
jgi:hypothetical protein